MARSKLSSVQFNLTNPSAVRHIQPSPAHQIAKHRSDATRANPTRRCIHNWISLLYAAETNTTEPIHFRYVHVQIRYFRFRSFQPNPNPWVHPTIAMSTSEAVEFYLLGLIPVCVFILYTPYEDSYVGVALGYM